ncbi:hypothetical protein CPAST_c37070 [Clostridium pasteurianum DSM 525 = ATCC 6013]|uniref:UvrB/UvrC protein n=1 Tax=Clostridium pasteurianum DSM 525 = ATCC 6013 TaxID=1262449 RepID=A0A0H3J770_CLOPA|nr:UvrB/UvrC motif-containing protein [Clostridium pasteurianum]AJA49761.1 hypothetical protein CPAST_c37070 [Clostridium pasteurianum DSM 525 = ATCC 6013]AJA53749.1 hypothetical protein CLPA_c37070 [Clostridium pasteurianum DSM 525 = ATCC 6013]AOZ76911.1 excinuclease [Clostridium pasteurianum DSM 525 = ATCC 6013]AOZ80708.1 excinuclease [Clostridium pasteurianum]ELP57548.1 hypothetical protein F502_18733 [Clostridium pasteurianum DSM 525 = ATCC 6013]
MLCEMCKKKEATFFITKIVNGNKQQICLCENCAKEFDGFNVSGEIGIISPFSLQNILSGLMNYMTDTPNVYKESQVRCQNCGMTLDKFKKTGLLGCSECYKNFNSTVNPVIYRVQGKVEHVGKIPKKSGKGIIERKRIINLKEDLQKAIALENYEEAAKIRDKIRSLEDNK